MVLCNGKINIWRKKGGWTLLLTLILAVTFILALFPAKAGAEEVTLRDAGELQWSWKLDNFGLMGLSSPATDGENFYITSSTADEKISTLYRFDADGNEIDSLTLSTGKKSYNVVAPTIAGDVILVPLDASQIAVIDRVGPKLKEIQRIVFAPGQDTYQTNIRITWDAEDNAAYVGSWRFWKENDHFHQTGTYVRIDLNNYTDYKVTNLTGDDTLGFYWSSATIGGNYLLFGTDSSVAEQETSSGRMSGDPNSSKGDAVIYAYDKTSPADSPKVLSASVEGSGSICTTAVWDGSSFYIVGKAGVVYRAWIQGDKLQTAELARLPGVSTCCPVIDGDSLLVGSADATGYKGVVSKIDLATGKILQQYNVPAEVKTLIVSDGRVLVTYNNKPGGIYYANYNEGQGKDYFIPPKKMKEYCISTILEKQGTFYYVNDSYHFMAVKPAVLPEKMASPKVKRASAKKVKVAWTEVSGVEGYQISQSPKKNKETIVVKAATGKSKKISAAKKKKFYYKVRAYKTIAGKVTYGEWSEPVLFQLK